jgi:hypothetical protein
MRLSFPCLAILAAWAVVGASLAISGFYVVALCAFVAVVVDPDVRLSRRVPRGNPSHIDLSFGGSPESYSLGRRHR